MPQSIDQMTELMNLIDPNVLAAEWNLSRKAVRSRLNGERDLTLSEVGALADLVGIDLLLHSLGRSFHENHRVYS